MTTGSLYDVVIVGAGVSGLCLARALLEAGGGWSILLVDGAQDDDALRTLSFWTSAPGPLDALVRHWVDEGCPEGPTRFTSFPEWGRVVGGILYACGLGDPCLPHPETETCGDQ